MEESLDLHEEAGKQNEQTSKLRNWEIFAGAEIKKKKRSIQD